MQKNHLYVERLSGERTKEKVYGGRALALLYGPLRFLAPVIARLNFLSRAYGYLQKRPRSRRKVHPFVETFAIDLSECEKKQFSSFNDFFIRKLKPEARPIAEDEAVIPADGRYWVCEALGEQRSFYLKGKRLSLSQILGNAELAEQYRNGAAVFGRLAPVDCHRFVFPVSGTTSAPRLINGPLYSVNPKALRHNVGILSSNKRFLTFIESPIFGQVAMLEVGATCVGSVVTTYDPDKPAQKGQEKGYFEFGGSAIVLFFEAGRLRLASDLMTNSGAFLETRCLIGQSLGCTFF